MNLLTPLLIVTGLGWLLPFIAALKLVLGLMALPFLPLLLPVLIPLFIAKAFWQLLVIGLKLLFLPIYLPYRIFRGFVSVVTFGIL